MFPKNSGFSPQIIHFNRVFHYFHHPFWGPTPIFGNTHVEDVNCNPVTCSLFRFPCRCLRLGYRKAWALGDVTLNSHKRVQQRPIPIVHGNLFVQFVVISRLSLGRSSILDLFVLVILLRIVPPSKATICKKNLWTCLPRIFCKQMPFLKLT